MSSLVIWLCSLAMEGGQYICSENRQLHGAVIKLGIYGPVSAASNNGKGEVAQLERKRAACL